MGDERLIEVIRYSAQISVVRVCVSVCSFSTEICLVEYFPGKYGNGRHIRSTVVVPVAGVCRAASLAHCGLCSAGVAVRTSRVFVHA